MIFSHTTHKAALTWRRKMSWEWRNRSLFSISLQLVMKDTFFPSHEVHKCIGEAWSKRQMSKTESSPEEALAQTSMHWYIKLVAGSESFKMCSNLSAINLHFYTHIIRNQWTLSREQQILYKDYQLAKYNKFHINLCTMRWIRMAEGPYWLIKLPKV